MSTLVSLGYVPAGSSILEASRRLKGAQENRQRGTMYFSGDVARECRCSEFAVRVLLHAADGITDAAAEVLRDTGWADDLSALTILGKLAPWLQLEVAHRIRKAETLHSWFSRQTTDSLRARA
jgi:hypothetical protein